MSYLRPENSKTMKNQFILIAIFSLISTSLISQDFWEEVLLPETNMMASVMSVNDDGTLFLGTSNYRFFYSFNNGDSWTESSLWPEYHWASCMVFNSSGDLIVGTSAYGVMRSSDGGDTFTEINNGLTSLNVWAIDINDNGDIIVGTPVGIFRSVNNGDLWEAIGSELPGDIEAVNYGSNNRIYVGTFEEGMWRSSDNGTSWESINTGLPDSAMITSLAVVPDVELFAAVFPDGLFHSTDLGDSWVPYNTGLPFETKGFEQRGFSISNIVMLDLFIYVAIYNYGAYLLMRSLGNYYWLLQASGLPLNPAINYMAGGGSENNLYLSTYDQEMFRNAHPVGVEKIEALGSNFTLGKISPNPITNSASFTFSVSETSLVSISIYNLAGQEIEKVVDMIYEEGTYNVNWTPQLTQGGIYFCKMRAGNFSTTKKIIYLK